MKIISQVLIFISMFTFIGCVNDKTDSNSSDIDQKSDVESSGELSNSEESIDIDFNTFIDVFSKDSLFQISRVKFPLEHGYLDYEKDYEESEKTIELVVWPIISSGDVNGKCNSFYSQR